MHAVNLLLKCNTFLFKRQNVCTCFGIEKNYTVKRRQILHDNDDDHYRSWYRKRTETLPVHTRVAIATSMVVKRWVHAYKPDKRGSPVRIIDVKIRENHVIKIVQHTACSTFVTDGLNPFVPIFLDFHGFSVLIPSRLFPSLHLIRVIILCLFTFL